jgi:hypothetical protein
MIRSVHLICRDVPQSDPEVRKCWMLDIRIRRISARRNQMFENYQPPSNVNVYLLVINNRFIVWQKP